VLVIVAVVTLDEFVWQMYLLHCFVSCILADELSKLGTKLLEVNLDITQLLIAFIFFSIIRCAKYCDQHVCTFVCLFVSLFARMFQKTYVQTFQSLLCMLPVAVVEFF